MYVLSLCCVNWPKYVKCCARCYCLFVCCCLVFLDVLIDSFDVIILSSFLGENAYWEDVDSHDSPVLFPPPEIPRRQTSSRMPQTTATLSSLRLAITDIWGIPSWQYLPPRTIHQPHQSPLPQVYIWHGWRGDPYASHERHICTHVIWTCPVWDASRLKRQCSYLKHVYLLRCSPECIAALKNCLGHKIGDVAGGCVLTLCAVPSSLTMPGFRLQNTRLYGVHVAELLLLKWGNERVWPTPQQPATEAPLSRNRVPPTSRLNSVLMVDQTFILCLLDQAVEKTNRCSFLQVIATLRPFDQRDPDILQLGDLVVPGSVESASVHLASKGGHTPPPLTLWHASPD